jgi:hypothetical protein
MSNTDDSPDDPAEESTNNLINDAIKFFKDIIDKNGTQLSGGKFTFPLDLDEQEMIRFEIFKEYKFDRREKGETDTLATIYLPIPQNLATTYSADYVTEDLGFLGMKAAGAVSVAMGGTDNSLTDASNWTNGVLNMLAQAVESGGAAVAVGGLIGSVLGPAAGTLTAGLSSGVGAQIGKGAMFGAGIARNPHQAQVFKNVQFRTHTFQYKFAPKSKEESDTLLTVSKLLRAAMHPIYFADNHFFEYPLQFDIDILDGHHAYLFDIGPSVMTNYSFDPTPNGPYFHYDRGFKIPVAVNISMTFKELSIVTQKEVSEYNY